MYTGFLMFGFLGAAMAFGGIACDVAGAVEVSRLLFDYSVAPMAVSGILGAGDIGIPAPSAG